MLTVDEKRTWIEDTIQFMRDKENKQYYTEEWLNNQSVSDLTDSKVEDLFKEMLDNGDIDISDLYDGDIYGW